MTLNPGDLVGNKYRIERVIGDGGMGTVYAARHKVLGTDVALKFLHPNLVTKAGLAQRFLQEAQLSARIQSPHVTRVTDMDQLPDGSAYQVMELLSGESLHTLLEREHKLPQGQAVDFTLQLLAGLEAAHALDVVHRDLKPDNVFISSSSSGSLVKILDFGIAKLKRSTEFQKILTRPGSVMGTPEYMSPEQAYSSDTVDVRSDLYSVGVMLYEMLTGVLPAEGNNAQEIAQKVISNQVEAINNRDPSIPAGLASVVHRAISAYPDKRYASASEMRHALWRFAQSGHSGRASANRESLPMVSASTVAIKQFNPSSFDELAGTAKAIAPTIPPLNDAPPPTVSAFRATELGSVEAFDDRPVQRTLHPAPSPTAGRPSAAQRATPYPKAPRRSSRIWIWVASAVAILGGAAALLGWFYWNASEPIAPPLPTPVQSASATSESTRRGSDAPTHRAERDNSAPNPQTATTQSRSTAVKGTNKVARSTARGADAGVPLKIPLPQIQLPTSLPPLPSILPSTLPPFLTIPPTFTLPGASQPKPSNSATSGSQEPGAPK